MDEKRESGAWAQAYGGIGQQGVRMMELPLSVLDPWESPDGEAQPFRPYKPDKLRELAENIKANGIIEAIRVRPRNGRFQILAGHNRCRAAAMAGLTRVPAIVEDVDDIQAQLIMLDSNLQHREKLLPSEKAKAYEMQLKALKRKAGRPAAGNYSQVGNNLAPTENYSQLGNNLGGTSSGEMAEKVGESKNQIFRYIRLNELHQDFLDMVDNDMIGLTTGVDLSYIDREKQDEIFDMMANNEMLKLTGKQAKALRGAAEANTLTRDTMEEILGLTAKPPKEKPLLLQIDVSQFPKETVKQLRKDQDFYERLIDWIRNYIGDEK